GHGYASRHWTVRLASPAVPVLLGLASDRRRRRVLDLQRMVYPSPNTSAIPPSHDAEAVVLDLVKAAGSGWRFALRLGQTGRDESRVRRERDIWRAVTTVAHGLRHFHGRQISD